MKKIAVFLLGCSLAACTVPAMQTDSRLQGAAQAMPVDGRQGWLISQELRFGTFHGGPVRRSWTKGYDYPFIIRFSGAKEKLGFTVRDGAGQQAEMFCLGKLSEQDFTGFHKVFDINFRSKDVFSCSIAFSDQKTFEFLVHDLNQNRTSGEVAGQIRGAALQFDIRPVWTLASGQNSWDTRPLGYEFVDANRAMAAVETVNQGRVWIDRGLPGDQQLVLAGVAMALLLRSDLADHND